MATKEHVTKVVNGATEHAVQIVTGGDPGSPVDGQIWFDKAARKLAIFASGQQTALNVQVLAIDPLTPQDGQVWVNSTTNVLSYRSGGSTFTINLTAGTGTSSQPSGNYYAILSADELNALSNVGSTYPNFLLDDYNSISDISTYTNAQASGSALRLLQGQNSGKVEYSMPTSTHVDEVEGIAVLTPRAVKPLTYVDNGDGTSTVTVAGDVTGLFANLKSLLVYTEVTLGGQVRSVYATAGNNLPAIFNVIGTPTYNSGTKITTMVWNNSPTANGGGGAHVDILAQLGVAATAIRFYPYDLTIQAGGGGIGSITPIPLIDAHGLDAIRTLGGDVSRLISADLVGHINAVVVKKSPSGQYTMMGIVHQLPGDNAEMVFYYSSDNMNTFNRIVPTYPCNGGWTYDQMNSQGGQFWMDVQMKVSDAGKFILAHPYWNNAGYYRSKIAYGDLTAPSPVLIYTPSYGGGIGIAYESDAALHMVIQDIHADDNFNYIHATNVRYDDHLGRDIWYSNGGATFMGTSDWYYYDYISHTNGGRFYNSLEGQMQFVKVGANANNGYPQFMKKKMSEIIAAAPFTGNYSAFRMNPMLDNESNYYPVSSSYGTCFLMDASMDDDKVRTIYWSDSSEVMIYVECDLVAPFPGTDEQQNIAFSLVPNAGQWSLQFGANTTSALGFSATASQVQTALQALASIGSGNVLVTGNYASGFNVHFTGALGKAPQALISVVTDTLTSSSTPVTINITETTLGVVPIYPHVNNQQRHANAGVGDVVIMFWQGSDGDYTYAAGDYSGGTVFIGNFGRRFKKHPTVSTRAFMAYPRYRNTPSPLNVDGLLMQFDHLSTFQGAFYDAHGSNTLNAILGSQTTVNNGDKHAQLITFDRNITVRSISVRGYLSWNNFPSFTQRSNAPFLRAKLVNASGGLPNEASVVEISPTKINLYDYWNSIGGIDQFFRFNTAVTTGEQLYLVLYTEGITFSTDPATTGASGNCEWLWLGTSGNTSANLNAYYQGGVWTNGTLHAFYRLYDFFIEPLKTPDMAQYPKFDMTGPAYASRMITDVSLALNQAQTQMQAIYRITGNIQQNNDSWLGQSTLCYRTLSIPAIDTFMADLNATTPTQFLGYDPSTFDPNLHFHVRLSDPTAVRIDKFGQPRYADTAHTRPMLGIDYAGGYEMDAWSTNQFLVGNINYGHTKDNRFKSGWATHWGQQGYTGFYANTTMNLGNDNFIMEFEVAPSAADIALGTMIFASFGAGNGWYVGMNSGHFCFVNQNEQGPALASGSTSQAAAVLAAGEYCRLRVTKGDDQLIRLWRWRNSGEGWVEFSYSSQINFNHQFFFEGPFRFYLGSHYNNAYNMDGLMGEVKIAIGTTTWKNGDAIYDQRPLYALHNFGDRVFCKKLLNHCANTSTSAGQDAAGDYYADAVSQAITVYPQAQTGLVAGRDQLLTFKDTTLPQGKMIAARVQLDRVGVADQPSVQGILLNYSKQ